ncbi:MAG TPA: ABC transporter permease [Clostridiales bacterium]|nr:ABC transporter permease [Clostridiales bacterium]
MKGKISISNILKSYGTLIASLLIIITFTILRPQYFATISNAINISRQISLLVVISIGATFVMTIGEFDLSIGAQASLGGIIAAMLAVEGVPIILAFIIPMAVGAIIGLLNGLIITKFKVLSFIITLGMSTILAGVTFWLTNGATIFENIPQAFKFIGTERIMGIPLLTIIMVILVIAFSFIMKNTLLGRRLYSIGGNEVAARVSGINVDRNKIIGFSICGVLSTLAGVLLSSRLGSAHPNGGDGMFLQAYAAVYIGSTISKQGVPNIVGTFVGAAILGILANGLTILQVPTFMQDLLTGLIIIGAVILQRLGSNKND